MIKLNRIEDKLNLQVISGSQGLERSISRGYTSDLMSDVIANTQEGDLWITLQTHLNIVAVAVMNDLAGIILVGGRMPEIDVIEKAEEEQLPIMISELPAFELIGRLYGMGIAGSDKSNEKG